MPGMDGLTVLSTMKRHDAWKSIPVLMYSGDTSDDKIDEARRLGAADYIVKGSISFDQLLARIGELAGAPTKPTGLAA